MKGLNLSRNKVQNLDQIPMVLVIGKNEQYKAKLLNLLLSDDDFYSRKYGRIIYIGQRRYKSDKIIFDDDNWKERASYQDIIDLLDDAKAEKIINLLIVINTRNIQYYSQTIEKIMGLRMTYLPGIISMMINLSEIDQLKKDTIQSFNTFFCFQSEKIDELCSFLKIKKQLQVKRKKDVYILGHGVAQIFRQIKD